MLETLREFALERLEEAGERVEVALRHARYYLQRLEEIEPVRRGPRMAELHAWFDVEVDNTWAALDELLASADEDAALSFAVLLAPFWVGRGRLRQGVASLETVLAHTSTKTASRGRALTHLGDLLERLGRPRDAEPLFREAVAIAEAVGDRDGLAFALRNLAWIEYDRGSFAEAAELGRAARTHAAAAGHATPTYIVDHDLGVFLSHTEDGLGEAQQLLEGALAEARAAGDEISVASTLVNVGALEIARGEYAAARRHYEAALESRLTPQGLVSSVLVHLGSLDLLEHDRSGALRTYLQALQFALESEIELWALYAADGVAVAAAETDPGAAARILGASRATRAERGIALTRRDQATYGDWFQELRQLAGDDVFERELIAGAELTPEQATELALDLARRAGAD